MFVGVQFFSPNGWNSFRSGKRYYFAGDRADGTVLIVFFARHKRERRAHTIVMPREVFESGFLETPPKLKAFGKQLNLPEWLQDVDEVDFDAVDEKRVLGSERRGGCKRSLRSQPEARLLKLALALDRRMEILQSGNPLRLIASTAYDGDSTKHPYRLQVWFFAFVLHGDNLWALKQPTHNNGMWDRSDPRHCHKKFGRPAACGSCFGSSAVGMREEILECYDSRAAAGESMSKIHRKSLTEHFGCVEIEDEMGVAWWSHPENRPFPSYGQFRRVVVEDRGLGQIQTTLYGAPRMRRQARVELGNYSQQYANILEAVQVDAYYVSERPKSFSGIGPALPLCVAIGVCVTTGAEVGIGFSYGAETAEAYRAMLFCMIAPKGYIARLYGLSPNDLRNWVMRGLPANLISDRGPGGGRLLASRLEQQFPMKTIVPTSEPQSKAHVESTNPRTTRLDGSPTFVQSNLDVIQLVKREVLRAARTNHTKDISSRLTEEQICDFHREGRLATPHHLWQYLEHRMRTSARSMTLSAGVRAFWTPKKLPVDRYGVRFRFRYYNSDQFRSDKHIKALNEKVLLRCYVLGMSIRYIWAEVDGELMELEAVHSIRSDIEDLMVPLSAFEEVANQLRDVKSRTRISASAALSLSERKFKEATGHEWDEGERHAGSPKKPKGLAALEGDVIRGRSSEE